MKHTLHTLLFLFLSISIISAQGIIVNEISNGAVGVGNGDQEYIELVVIGNDAAPTAGVDLTGWVIDDNNGDFNAPITGVGIASGHLRITGSCLSNVAPGTIIVIYNDGDPNANVPADDINDSNGDCIYIIPASSSCIEACTSIPNSSGPTTTYSGCTYGAGQYVNMQFANTGDAAQTRRPDFSFYHGISYGPDIGTAGAFPSFPADLGGGSSFNVAPSGTGAGRFYYFNNGSFTAVGNYARDDVANGTETPGAPNNDLNRAFINALRDGTYNYSDLSANSSTATATGLSSCISLPVYLSKFEGEKEGERAILKWEVESTTSEYFTFEIERSATGYNFEKIGELGGFDDERYYSFEDLYPGTDNYYRLKMIDPDGSYRYSKVVHLEFESRDAVFSLSPNPVVDLAVVRFDYSLDRNSQILIYNMLGKLVRTINVPAHSNFQTIPVGDLPKGNYTLVWYNSVKQRSLKFIK
jgi:hypothetical protein